jgi:sugar lactone lactonase YvrE
VGRFSDLEIVLDARADVGEGPVWDPHEQMLVWVDITSSRVHFFTPASGHDDSIDVGQHVGAAAVRDGGGLVLAVRDGFAALDKSTGSLEMLADTEAALPGNRMNDGKCDSSGRFWAGTMAYDFQSHKRAGALYRLEIDQSVTRVLGDVTLANGLGWSPDDSTMYFIDSATQRIDVFNYDSTTGVISNRRTLIAIPEEVGLPDGMTVDADGFVWVALWGAGKLHRYSRSGDLDRVVELPVTQVTSCCFGGEDLGDLYITSAAYELSPDHLRRQPHAGALFRLTPGVVGLPPHGYAG